MSGGPNASIQHASVQKDKSSNIYETWPQLLQNFFIIIIVASMAWSFVTVLRYSITYGSDYLFSPFVNLHENKEQAKRSKEGTFKPFLLEMEKNVKPETSSKTVEEQSDALDHHAYIIFIILILAAIIRGALLHLPSWKTSEGDGMGQSLEFYHDTYNYNERKPQPRFSKPDFLQAIRRLILTTLTIGSGGSGGIEAPVVPIGECIGAGISRFFKITKSDDLRIYQLAGMSAAVATLLDAPFTAALFAAEIVYDARILYRPLMYSLIGAIIAYALNNHFLNFEPLFTPRAHSLTYTLKEYVEVSVVALICSAPASLGLALLFKYLKKMIKPFPGIIKPIIGAVGTGGIALGIWFGFSLEPQHVLGVSEETLIQIMAGDGNPLLKVWWVLLLLVVAKTFTTGFTLMAGGSAGALIPAMFLGGVSGAAIYQGLIVLGYPLDGNVAVFVVAGLASALVAVIHVPLAAIALVLEVFGTSYGPPAILSCVLTYLLARRWKLYMMAEEK